MRTEVSDRALIRIADRSLVEVFGNFLGWSANQMSRPRSQTAVEGAEELRVLVRLIGKRYSGDVTLRLPQTLAERGFRKVLGMESISSVGEEELKDFSKELGNMIAGRVASGLAGVGVEVKLSTPRILKGSGKQSPAKDSVQRVRTSWLCQSIGFTLDLGIRRVNP